MKLTVVTIRVVGNPTYDGVSERWIRTYMQFKPQIDHEVVVVNCDHEKPDGLYDPVATRYLTYSGGGWDCGTWQFVAKEIQTDLLVCCNTSTYFWKQGWLERFLEAAQTHGDGLYGSMASYECAPHIRTPCYVFQPKIMWEYPLVVDSRAKCYTFEALGGPLNFTTWCRAKGYRTMLVTWDGFYGLGDWRKPPNIFRRGDQSNILVKDRHVDTYAADTETGKRNLERLADGK